MNKPQLQSTPALWRKFFALCAVFVATVLHAQSTGTISGRVLNQGTGEYLRNASITVVGTNLSATSEAGGEFTISGVPAGDAKLSVSYAGLDTVESNVTVTAGQTVRQNVSLTSADYSGNNVLKLGEFVVSSEREGNAKAIMEQRQALNMKSVLASDAFGDVSEGNIGEFAKLLPGVTIDYNEADARAIRIRGLDPKYTSVLMDGAPVATGGSSDVNLNRTFDAEQLSIASIETVELSKTPRPMDSGSSLAGVVNLRSKGAFDYKGRRVTFQTSVAMNSLDMTLKKTPGWEDEKTYKIMPNASAQYSDVFFGDRLGVMAGFNYSYTFGEQKAETVSLAGRNTDPNDNATEPLRITSVSFRDSPKPTTRKNYNTRFDFKLPNVLGGELWTSTKVDYNTYSGKFFSRDLTFNFTTVDATQPSNLRTVTTAANGGSVQPNGGGGGSDKNGTTLTWNATGNYKRGAFTAFVVGQYSKATNRYADLERGFFATMGTNALPATLRFERGGPLDPGVFITQLGGADWRNLSNYTLATAGTTKRATDSKQFTLKDDMTYDFSGLELPTKVYFGFAVNESLRDLRRYSNNLGYTYVGPDGLRNTADDNPARLAEPYYRMNFGYGGNVDGMTNVDRFALGRALRDNPGYFQLPNFVTGMTQFALQNSYYLKEQINAAYLEPVIKLGKNFRIAPGTRYEYTRDVGRGPVDLGDREARRRLTGSPTGTVDTASEAYVFTRYGAGRRSGGATYGTWLRYLHASYDPTSNLVLRASYHESITRPDLVNLIPGINSINETAVPPTVTVSNPDLRPEHARNVNFQATYYFSKLSSVGLTLFRTDAIDLQRRVTEDLGPDGFQGDTSYAGYLASVPENVGKAHNSGLELEYYQSLGFLPGAFKGTQVFANVTILRPDNQDNYLNSANHSANGGIKYRYRGFGGQIAVNWTGVVKTGAAAAAGTANAGWANYTDDRLKVDLQANYTLGRGLTLFATARNIFNERTVTYTRGGPNLERVGTRWFNSGAIVTMGVRGSF